MSIVDLYFFEELSSTAGHEIGTQWLKKIVANSLKRRKSAVGRSFSRLTNGSSGKTPDTSTPSSPRSWTSAADATTQFDKYSAASGNIPLEQSTVLFTHWPDETFKTANQGSKLYPTTHADISKEGLVFTDAAHTVID